MKSLCVDRPPTSPRGRLEANPPNAEAPERIPSQWAWHYRTLRHLRDRLLRAHVEHVREAAVPAEARGVDAAETAQEQSDRDLLWAELGMEDDKLFEIDCALQRIRDGAYGFCEDSGRAIPSARLRAIPWTRYCRGAAAGREFASRLEP